MSTPQPLQQSQYRTLIEQSTTENPLTISGSGNVVSQIIQNTQNSPSRQQKTFVYRSESPIRSSQYGRNVVNVSTIQRNDAPVIISKSTTQNPIYVEKIVKVESSNTQELNILRQRIQVLEANNKTLTEELIELRGATPQQVEQIVYIENNDELNRIKNEFEMYKLSSAQELEGVKRAKKAVEDQNQMLLQERERLLAQLQELSLRLNELQVILPQRDAQIKALQVQNENYAIRLVLTTAELEHLVRERTEVEPLKRKVADLEQYLLVQERTIEDLRNKLLQQDQLISQLRVIEVRAGQQEIEINGLKARIEELLRTIQVLQNNNSQKDQEIAQLNVTINQLNLQIQQLQNIKIQLEQTIAQLQRDLEQLHQAYTLRLQEIEDLKKRCADYDLLVIRIKQLEARIADLEKENAGLKQQLLDLQNSLNDETVKRSKRDGDLEMSLRDKQLLEEKLVHFTQQIEFMSRKIASYEDEIAKLRARIADLENQNQQIPVLQNQVAYLTQQIEKLTGLLNERDQLIQKLNIELTQLRVTAALVPGLQEEIRKLQEIIVLRTAEIESLTKKVQERELVIVGLQREKQQLEERTAQLLQQIEYLTQRIQQLEAAVQERDTTINKLRIEIQQLNVQLLQLQRENEELKKVIELIQQKLAECEQNNALLRQRIGELENALNEETIKRSKVQSQLDITLREKSLLEEKLAQLSQQIEFLSRKLTITEQENVQLRRVAELVLQLIEQWNLVQSRHSEFTTFITQVATTAKTVLTQSSSSSTIVRSSQQIISQSQVRQ